MPFPPQLSQADAASVRRQIDPLDPEAAYACGPGYLLPAELRRHVLRAVFAEWGEADRTCDDSVAEAMGPAERALAGLMAARVEACSPSRSWS
jgi:hypothetical protein